MCVRLERKSESELVSLDVISSKTFLGGVFVVFFSSGKEAVFWQLRSYLESCPRSVCLSVCLLNFQPSLFLSRTSLIAWLSLGRPPSLRGFQRSQPEGGKEPR